jgi:oxygen-independent coproporphyrinogen-3 oxidase
MASLYLHIPFCEHKCVYCDFYSIESLDPMEAFVQALRKEIGMYSFQSDEPFETIFFGGGTPSLLTPATVGGLLDLLAGTFTILPDAEITLEANPGTVD